MGLRWRSRIKGDRTAASSAAASAAAAATASAAANSTTWAVRQEFILHGVHTGTSQEHGRKLDDRILKIAVSTGTPVFLVYCT